MGRFLLTVLALCTLNASVHGKAIVSPRKQAELMVSGVQILILRIIYIYISGNKLFLSPILHV